jgi:crotonobetainyl-CoA:carnitine CoA-transferase CaiB-like acyl-CoA transferase
MTPEARDESSGSKHGAFMLAGVRVVEVANELGEYGGKVLAGLGADVIKIEPPGGAETRAYGPFRDDVPGAENSLYFWHYNLGKRSIRLDLDDPADQAVFRDLARTADVVLDTYPLGYLPDRAIGYEQLKAENGGLIYARISPFGDNGPWSGYRGSDLVHLALGGVVMNSGYDSEPSGFYDTPPLAPQMWQSYQIVGEMAVMGILAALLSRTESGRGQQVSISVHEAVSKNTETDIPNWVYLAQTHYRKTCRHSSPAIELHSLARTKDGRWVLPYQTYLPTTDQFTRSVRFLKKWSAEADLEDDRYLDPSYRASLAGRMHISDVMNRLVGRVKFARRVWDAAQAEGMPWSPINRPEENVGESQWRSRGTITEVAHPELGQSFSYIGARWYSPTTPWRIGERAPLLGEHSVVIRAEVSDIANRPPADRRVMRRAAPLRLSAREQPFAMNGVRVVDLSWFLASGGAGRFLAAFGAEVIRVEHETRHDGMRWSQGQCPPGGRAARRAATDPMPTPPPGGPNRSGSFMEINAGKLGISLNLKNDQGLDLLRKLISTADVVLEGFSPGTMDRLGLGWDRLRQIKPDIIYVQQSGSGQYGRQADIRTFGPTAAGFSGISDMCGLPEPYPPAGIGYSYLDWFGAYNMANAVLSALYRRRITGQGTYIDASQVEIGLYLTGTAVLDHSVNGRTWQRYGNRSPYKRAAPHGVYRTIGDDRWIAIACFDDADWHQLLTVLGSESLADDSRFRTLPDRLSNQDALDATLEELTVSWDGTMLMGRLQEAGVPAGVCQNAEDRVDRDPQLAHLNWLVEVPQSELGTWPVKEVPVVLSETPPYIGGPYTRSGPNYGEDNEYVFTSMLGYSQVDVAKFRAAGVL